MLRVFIIKIMPAEPSSHGGFYQRVFLKDAEGNSYRLDVYPSNRDSARFVQYLEMGSVFENMRVLPDRKKILDGTSNFRYAGRRQGRKKKGPERNQLSLF